MWKSRDESDGQKETIEYVDGFGNVAVERSV